MAIVAKWVMLPNLGVLIDELAIMAGERLDGGLHRVFCDDIRASNADASPPVLATYTFGGPLPIVATIGVDQGTDVLLVELELPEELVARAEFLFELMQRYVISYRGA